MLPYVITTIENDDDRAFMERLYIQNQRILRKSAYKILGNIDQIEDVINDSFVKLISKLALLKSLESYTLTAYIVYTVERICIDLIKGRDIKSKYLFYSGDDDLFESVPDTAKTPAETLLMNEKSAEIQEALAHLPERERSILQFKYVLEMSDDEIAVVFGIHKSSVRQYLTRARRNAIQFVKEMVSYELT